MNFLLFMSHMNEYYCMVLNLGYGKTYFKSLCVCTCCSLMLGNLFSFLLPKQLLICQNPCPGVHSSMKCFPEAEPEAM